MNQHEERLVVLDRLFHELDARVEEFLVDRLHALDGQRSGVLDLLRAVRVGPAVQHAARPELLLELRVLRIVGILRLLFGVQVIEVAEELIEPVRGRKEFVAIPQVVLAELPGHVAERLQDVGNRRVFRLQSEIGARQTDLGQPRADRRLARDECRAPRGTALLAIPVGKVAPLLGDAVDVRRSIPHDAVVVHADVEPANVISPDDENVRFVRFGHTSSWC